MGQRVNENWTTLLLAVRVRDKLVTHILKTSIEPRETVKIISIFSLSLFAAYFVTLLD